MKRPKITATALVLAFLLVCFHAEALAWKPDEGPESEASLLKGEEKGFYEKGAPALALFLLAGLSAYGVFVWNRKRGTPQNSTIRLVAVKPLGQREKVAILEILGERVVLGVTAHRISLLLKAPSSFSQSLRDKDEQG